MHPVGKGGQAAEHEDWDEDGKEQDEEDSEHRETDEAVADDESGERKAVTRFTGALHLAQADVAEHDARNRSDARNNPAQAQNEAHDGHGVQRSGRDGRRSGRRRDGGRCR